MGAILLQADNITRSIGFKTLFRDISFTVKEGDRIGLVARNGTGKSTLLRCLASEDYIDSGQITIKTNLKIGFLHQHDKWDGDTTPQSVADQIHNRFMAESHSAEFADESVKNFKIYLDQLGITDLQQKVSTMSGGQRKKIAIAETLCGNPELILLDEPTNHLDISTIEWLENYLKRTQATLIMVTHDRYFLDRITNVIIEIDNTALYSYEGNYDYFLRKKEERKQAIIAEKNRLTNKLRTEQEWISRQPQARGSKAKYRIDAFHEMKGKAAGLNVHSSNVNLNVDSSYIGKKIFEAKGVSKAFGDKKIIDDFTYSFARYEKIGLIGPNGVGKTTFIKLLQGLIESDAGEWNVGETVRFGYYRQNGLEMAPDKRVIDAVTEIAEDIAINQHTRFSPMQFLQHFLFTPEEQRKFIKDLSGGEKSRLHLATVLMQSPNFLILDEPTNDLDILTLDILEEYLVNFKGCVLIISHDRFFLDSIVDHIFVMEGDGKITDFPGNYSQYRQYTESIKKDGINSKQEENPNEKKKIKVSKPKLSFKETKELESIESELETLSAEKVDIEKIFSGEKNSDQDISTLSERYKLISNMIDEKESRWIELQEKIN